MFASARLANADASSPLNKTVAAVVLSANAVLTAPAIKAEPKSVVTAGAVGFTCSQRLSQGGIPLFRHGYWLCLSLNTIFKVIKMFRKILLMIGGGGLIAVSGCMSVPDNLNLALDRPTDRNTYQIELHSLADPIEINKIHAWEIKVRNPTGEAVTNARIDVDGGMPQHGHGFPTQPKVTRELGDGRYLLEGMKFSMPGWWEIKLNVTSSLGADNVTFNKVIELPQVADKPLVQTDVVRAQ